jgi:Uma2 family endonuclease
MGYFFSDGVRLSEPAVDLSTEPDAVFVSYDAIRSGRVRLVRGQLGGYVELEGSPELVVEIVSASSVRKDTELLREMYAQAGVSEYWLIDARKPMPTFELLQWTPNGYQPTPVTESGALSPVFSQQVNLTQETDPLGNPRFVLQLTPVK